MANNNVETCPEQFRYPGFHPLRTPPGAQTWQMGIADTVIFLKHYAAYDGTGAALADADNVTSANFLGVAVAPKGVVTGSANADLKVKLWTPQACESMIFWCACSATMGDSDVGTIAQFSNAGYDIHPSNKATHYGFQVLAIDTTAHNSIYYAKGTFKVVGA